MPSEKQVVCFSKKRSHPQLSLYSYPTMVDPQRNAISQTTAPPRPCANIKVEQYHLYYSRSLARRATILSQSLYPPSLLFSQSLYPSPDLVHREVQAPDGATNKQGRLAGFVLLVKPGQGALRSANCLTSKLTNGRNFSPNGSLWTPGPVIGRRERRTLTSIHLTRALIQFYTPLIFDEILLFFCPHTPK